MQYVSGIPSVRFWNPFASICYSLIHLSFYHNHRTNNEVKSYCSSPKTTCVSLPVVSTAAFWQCLFTVSLSGWPGWTLWQNWAPFDPCLAGCPASHGIWKQKKDTHHTHRRSQNNSSRKDESSQTIPSSAQLLCPAWLKSCHHMVWRCLAGHMAGNCLSFLSLLSRSFMLIVNNLERVLD